MAKRQGMSSSRESGAAKAGLSLSGLLAGGVAGGLLMYYLDPRSGRRRRAQARDKAVHAWKQTQDEVDMAARDFAHRVQGVYAESRHALRREEVDDQILVERVRSKLGRYCSHPHAVDVRARDGVVELSGPILSHEYKPLLNGIERVHGVKEVIDRLHAYDRSENIPSLQGGRPRPGPRADFLQDNWAPATRFMMGGIGAGLVLSAIRQSRGIGSLSSLIGMALFARAFTNRPLKRVFGIRAGRYAVELQKTINVNAPVEEVFAFFQAMNNFPRFMDHVKDVRQIGPDRWHWKVSGPGGVPFEWDAVARLEPSRLLTWKTVEGASVENAGVIHFEPRDGGTRVHIQMTYNPPGGVLGHTVARLLGADPKRQMDDDMLRFKSILEKGKATAHGHTVRREELAIPARGISPALPS